MSEREHKQILVVEDDVDTAEMIVIILKAEGYRVQWVSTAHAALDVFSARAAAAPSEHNGPDLILLDLMLPDMSGVELVRRLRQTASVVPPVIVTSAKPTPMIEAAARAVGGTAVRKPFDIDHLLASIQAALSRE